MHLASTVTTDADAVCAEMQPKVVIGLQRSWKGKAYILPSDSIRQMLATGISHKKT